MKLSVILLLVLLAAACGGRSSVASKSAEAYREAQEKGTALGGDGHDHGSHEAGTATTATVDHSAHETPAAAHTGDDAGTGHGMHAAAGSDAHGAHRAATDPGTHAAMGRTEHAAMSDAHAEHAAPATDHSAHGATPAQAPAHAGHTMPATDHSAHGATPARAPAHAGHTMPATDHSAHGATPAQAPAHAGHIAPLDRTGPDPHHPAAQIAAPAPVPVAPRSNAEMRNLQPSSTLQPDAFDAPAPVSVSEAARARAGGTDHGAHDPKKH